MRENRCCECRMKGDVRTRDRFKVNAMMVFRAVSHAFCHQKNGEEFLLDMFIPLKPEAREQVLMISLTPHFVRNYAYFSVGLAISQKARDEQKLWDFYFHDVLDKEKFTLDDGIFAAYEGVISFLDSFRHSAFWELHGIARPKIWITDRISLAKVDESLDIESFLKNPVFKKMDLGKSEDEISMIPVLEKRKDKVFMGIELRKENLSSLIAEKPVDFPVDSSKKLISSLLMKTPWAVNLQNVDEAASSCICQEKAGE